MAPFRPRSNRIPVEEGLKEGGEWTWMKPDLSILTKKGPVHGLQATEDLGGGGGAMVLQENVPNVKRSMTQYIFYLQTYQGAIPGHQRLGKLRDGRLLQRQRQLHLQRHAHPGPHI
jgi:hypothetical protein